MKKSNLLKSLSMLIFVCGYTVLSFAQSPKNIIIVVGNGVGYNHLEAARMFKGEELNFDNYPANYGVSTFAGISQKLTEEKTLEHFNTHYSTKTAWLRYDFLDSLMTDQWSAGTAMATGKKSTLGAVGVALDSTVLETVIERANLLGKKTGIVTNLPLSDNSVAPFAAHCYDGENRNDVAEQLLINSKLNVLFACGHPFFDNNGDSTIANYQYFINSSIWDSIVAEGETLGNIGTINDINGDEIADPWMFIESNSEFDTIGTNYQPDRLLGIYQVNDPRNGTAENAPTLSDMTSAALRTLNNDAGAVLVVESGKIDHFSRTNNKEGVINELIDLDNTIAIINEWVENNGGWEENLVIYTGSYESGMLLNNNADIEEESISTNLPLTDNGIGNIPGMNFFSEHITNMLVPMYAQGLGAEQFRAHANDVDQYRGNYITNSEIAQVYFNLLPITHPQTPRNVIVMIGDGMGYNQVQAGAYYMGGGRQFQSFPVQLASATYNYPLNYVSSQAWSDENYFGTHLTATCSAASGTALATGVKTKRDAIGVNINNDVLENITMHANYAGLATGVVTSMPIVDATPASFSAHNITRGNKQMLILEALIESNLSVLMGCGHPKFNDHGEYTEYWHSDYIFKENVWTSIKRGATEYTTETLAGTSTIQDIDDDGQPDAWSLIDSVSLFQALANGDTIYNRVIGVPMVNYTLQQKRQNEDNDPDLTDAYTIPRIETVPYLSTMAKGALNVLDAKNTGFFLMIEGGAIDQAGHYDQPGRMIEELVEFNNAVDTVIAWIESHGGWEENLLIVTADHETGYLVGSGFSETETIFEANRNIVDNGTGNMPGMLFSMRETKGHTPYDHTNQLVPFYAKGTGSDIFNNYADRTDFYRGEYITNAEIGQALFDIFNGNSGKIINQACTIIGSIPDLEATVDVEYNYELPLPIAIDPEDGEDLSYSISTTSLLNWLTYDEETHTIGGSPNRRADTYFSIYITDKDTSGIATQSVLKVYMKVNEAPVNITEADKTIEVYPNPCTDYIVAGIHGNFTHASISIINANGQLIYSDLLQENNSMIDVSELSSGQYSIVLNIDNTIYKKLIIVE